MFKRIKAAREYLEALTEVRPKIALVLGSGLGSYYDTVEIISEFRYEDIPGFPVSTAPGHASKLVFGKKFGVPMVLFCGRFHCYEGYSAAETVLPLRTILTMGAEAVLLTNAAGGINTDFQAGDLMIVTDHINFSGINALTGENIEELGVRFPDMSFGYSVKLREILENVGKQNNIELKHGVYSYMPGPSYETPAEIRALRILGADAVGMSTVHEVVACNHAGVDVAALSCISNLAAGVSPHPLSSEEVIEAGKKVADKMTALTDGFIKNV